MRPRSPASSYRATLLSSRPMPHTPACGAQRSSCCPAQRSAWGAAQQLLAVGASVRAVRRTIGNSPRHEGNQRALRVCLVLRVRRRRACCGRGTPGPHCGPPGTPGAACRARGSRSSSSCPGLGRHARAQQHPARQSVCLRPWEHTRASSKRLPPGAPALAQARWGGVVLQVVDQPPEGARAAARTTTRGQPTGAAPPAAASRGPAAWQWPEPCPRTPRRCAWARYAMHGARGACCHPAAPPDPAAPTGTESMAQGPPVRLRGQARHHA